MRFALSGNHIADTIHSRTHYTLPRGRGKANVNDRWRARVAGGRPKEYDARQSNAAAAVLSTGLLGGERVRTGNLLLALAASVSLAAGCAAPRTRPAVDLQIRLAAITKEAGGTEIKDPVDGETLFMYPEAVLTHDDIVSARSIKVAQVVLPARSPGSAAASVTKAKKGERPAAYARSTTATRPGVCFTLSWSGARRLRRELKKHSKPVALTFPWAGQGEVAPRLVILVEGKVFAVTPVKGKVKRKMLIVGSFSEAKAQRLAAALGGAVPAQGSGAHGR